MGAEYKLFKGNKAQIRVLLLHFQPSYILERIQDYLITTDYKNYVEIPWLIRRWNLNQERLNLCRLFNRKNKMAGWPLVRYQVFSASEKISCKNENIPLISVFGDHLNKIIFYFDSFALLKYPWHKNQDI